PGTERAGIAVGAFAHVPRKRAGQRGVDALLRGLLAGLVLDHAVDDLDAVDAGNAEIDRADGDGELDLLARLVLRVEYKGQGKIAEADAVEHVPRRFQREGRAPHPRHHGLDHGAERGVFAEGERGGPVAGRLVLHDLAGEVVPGETEAVDVRIVVEPGVDDVVLPGVAASDWRDGRQAAAAGRFAAHQPRAVGPRGAVPAVAAIRAVAGAVLLVLAGAQRGGQLETE